MKTKTKISVYEEEQYSSLTSQTANQMQLLRDVNVNEYPTLHYFGTPIYTQSMIAYPKHIHFSQ